MNKVIIVLLALILILSSVFFWWFGPRRENLIKQCSKEMFNGGWKIEGEDNQTGPLEKLKTMQETCLMEKGIK